MGQKKQLTMIEFSRLTGIKRENLRFYDRIGLLTPNTRGENNYRYYSRHQLNMAYLITNLRGLGVSIADIKQYAAEQTPKKTLALFVQQDARIETEIRQLHEMRLMMRLHADMVREMLAHPENAPSLEEKEREPIFLCPPIPAGLDEDAGSIFSYNYAEANGINLGFPQGNWVAQSRMESDEAIPVERYFFKVGTGGNACKPAGLRAVIYGRCTPWNVKDLYLQLLDFIQKQNLRVSGNAYEEYPFDDTTAQDREQFCIQVEIPVAKF